MFGIDLFSGAGGMSLGAEAAGIEVVFSVESDRHAAETYSHNHPGVELFASNICTLEKIGIGRRTRPLVVFGGPPCQGFSTSNQRTRSSDNPANWLYKEFLRIVGSVKPEWVVFENVKGIMETEAGRFFRLVLKGISGLGYNCTHDILNAADFGVPQQRFRLFIIGSRKGVADRFPRPEVAKHVTVREAIADLPELPNGASEAWRGYRTEASSAYAKKMRGRMEHSANHLVSHNADHVIERYRHISPGGNWEDIPHGLMDNYKDRTRCHTGIYHRLRDDRPSVTLGNYRKNMLIHPREDRGLSVREAARLQSFPDRFEFKGSIGFQQQQVGNAVPPLLAEAVFRAVAEVARGTRPAKSNSRKDRNFRCGSERHDACRMA